MSNRFEEIKGMYESSFKIHGDSPASLLTPKGRGELRFRAVEPFMKLKQPSVLDYGCGLGYLYEYLTNLNYSFDYTGVDILSAFIHSCRDKYDGVAEFRTISPIEPIEGVFDIVFASGVFNLRTNSDRDASKAYAFEKLKQLFSAADSAMVCDFPSSFVDFEQDDAQHFDIGEVANFCATHLTRRFVLRHDLLPYEFTLVAYKNDIIKRPENFFAIDAEQHRSGKEQCIS